MPTSQQHALRHGQTAEHDRPTPAVAPAAGNLRLSPADRRSGGSAGERLVEGALGGAVGRGVPQAGHQVVVDGDADQAAVEEEGVELADAPVAAVTERGGGLPVEADADGGRIGAVDPADTLDLVGGDDQAIAPVHVEAVSVALDDVPRA